MDIALIAAIIAFGGILYAVYDGLTHQKNGHSPKP